MQYNLITQSLKKWVGLNLTLATALLGLNQQILAHGQAAEMLPLYQNMSDFGAEVKKD